MRFINKKFMLIMTNVFLLAGIGSTIANYSTSVIQGEALSKTIVASFGSTNLTSGWTQTGSTLGSPPADYVRFRTNETNFVSTSSRSSLIDPLEQFTSSLTITFKVGALGVGGTSGFLRAEILNSSNTVLNSATGSFTLVNAAESYSQGSSITLAIPENPSEIDKFKMILHSSSFTDINYMRFQELTITYSSELTTTYDDATTFATTLINSTNDKENCLADDNWTTLSNSYTSLSSDAKNYFKNTSTNNTIINARARYNYLISFNGALNDFVFGV